MITVRMKNYAEFYQSLSAPFRKSEKSISLLNRSNQILTYLFYISYPCLLLYLLFSRNKSLLKTILIPACSFLMVSLIRRFVNRSRPYENNAVKPLIYKKTKGKSWPSRHVFSASVIAAVFLYFCTPLGIVLYILTILSAFVRVIGGVHYPSDVVSGFIIGALAGELMWIV